MTEENLPKYIEKIRKYKPKYINAYPSAISILANYIKKNKIQPFQDLKTIVCVAENLYDWQYYLIKEVFHCQPLAIYGLAERAALATTCEKNNYYHFFPQYGIVELIDKNGLPVTKENEKGEIVCTGFHNSIFPFIRYRTGDVGVFTTAKCTCGRNYPLLKTIEGRLQEYLVTKTGQIIPLTGSFGLIAKTTQNVKEYQFYQDTKGEIVLYIIKRQEYSYNDEKMIKHNFSKKIGNEIDLIIKYVDYIPRTTRGKYRFLIQKLPIKF
jgi:phenylacetate-CoA ligase